MSTHDLDVKLSATSPAISAALHQFIHAPVQTQHDNDHAQHLSLRTRVRCFNSMESGWLIRDNEFVDTEDCVFIGGGRQNVVVNNTFKNCAPPLNILSLSFLSYTI